jgi:hypothetical protein
MLAILPGIVSALPDFQILVVTPNMGTATGSTVFTYSANTVTAQVKNNGPDASPEGLLLLQASDGFSGTGTIPAMSSGTFQFVQITDTTVRTVAGGTVNYTATADPYNAISEANEDNNVKYSGDNPVKFNGYRGKALYGGPGGNDTTRETFDIRGDIVHSFGDSYYRSGSYGGGWYNYNVTWNGTSPAVPANGTVLEARLYLPYTWDYPDDIRGRDLPNNATILFNSIPITNQRYYWDQGNFGEWGPYRYGLLSYDVTSLYVKNSTNYLNFTRTGENDKLSLYGMSLVVIYENPAESRKQIFINEEFDLLGADPANYKTTEEETTAYIPFDGMTIVPAQVKAANLTTFVPSGDSGEGNLLYNGAIIAEDVWDYGAFGQPVGEDGSPQVAVDVRDVKSYLQASGNTFGIQSTAWNVTPCMAAIQELLVVEYQDAPVAAFAGDVATGDVPLTVQFTDQSYNDPTSWLWEFGDGNTSTLQNPNHTYVINGTKTVVLTATNGAGSDSETKTNYINVTGLSLTKFPAMANLPNDLDYDLKYEDVNGNNRKDVGDVVLFFDNLNWAKTNEPVPLFDFNSNGRLDVGDIVARMSL